MPDNHGNGLPNPVETDPYYKKVLTEAVEPLIVRSITDKDNKLDATANMEATRTNFITEANRLSELIAEQSSSQPVTDDCSKLLTDANKLISSISLDSSAVLEKMDAIKHRLLRAHESRKAQPFWFPFLALLNFAWLVVIGFFIGWKMLIPGQEGLQQVGLVALACALWGGIGGVVDAFFALHSHFSKQDFDVRYRPWYFLHPILGLSLGVIVFLLMQAGLLAISNTQLKEVTANVTSAGGSAGGVPASGTILPIAVALLAGFKQTTAYEFVGRIVKSVFQKDSE
jgi:hypothetical protein